ncbi:MAG: type VI secretion system membrane subunit TssM [Burkholderiales bacterium]|nr:type VI secretion system membrane subunit TssM [Burkholderiales bacterium]
MRKLFKNRWFLGVLMVAAVALVIWFIGPAIAVFDVRPLERAAVRAIVIFAVAGVWLGIELGRLIAARQANKKLLEGIAGAGSGLAAAPDKSVEEVALLRQRFEEAAGVLKKAKFSGRGGESQFLYQLPWYVFIGAPGSGKTTALINSGLRFAVGEGADGHAVKGVGGTRNCDWWFTEEAVLLDTAGRYTTQESEQKTDAAAWLGFLDLLKKHRPRRPLNGAIITVSVSDLLSWSEAERIRYCDAVRQRVQELYSRLGVRFPLYVMVTKCDLLAGFNEFFATYGRDERAQVWGMTFPHTPQATAGIDYAALFGAEFQALDTRLNGLLVDRLQQERDQQRRALIYNFPQQFGGLRPLLGEFVGAVFSGSRYTEQPMLRGVYFTSGTQEGSPIDRVLGTLARSFKLERKILPPSVASGRSFFLTALLKDLIFPEAGLVGANAALERRLRALLYAGYATLALVSIGLLSLWGLSYARNQALIAEFEAKTKSVQDKIEKLPPPQVGDLPAVSAVLSAMRALGEPYADPGYSVPLSLGFGLYQGEKLGSQARRAYEHALRDAFLPRIALRLEQLIREVDNPVALYEVLKAYLMLYTDKVLDPKGLEALLALDWERSLPGGDGGQLASTLQGHLRAALANRPLDMVRRQEAQLVADARAKLSRASLIDRIYARLQQEAEASQLPAFSLSDAAGPNTAQVFERRSGKPLTQGVPGFFTVNGYYKAFRPAAERTTQRLAREEAWVLGRKAGETPVAGASGPILEDVRRRYLEDYIRTWNDFLGDVRLKRPENLAQTVQLVRLLSGSDSPLKRFVVAAAKETALAEADASIQAAGAKAVTDAVVDSTKKALGGLFGGAVKPDAAAPRRLETMVDDHFRELRALAAGKEGAPAQIDAIISKLREYHSQLMAMEEAERRGEPVKPPLAARELEGDAAQLPSPVREALRSAASAGMSQGDKASLDSVMKAVRAAADFCRKAIAGRYPFAKNSASEVTADDFSRVFSPGGELDEVFKSQVAQLVDTSGPAWRARGKEGPALPSAVIAQFQRAAVIRDAFFRPGSKTPAASAELRVLSMDERVSHVTLEVDNQVMRFDRVAALAVKIGWPSQRPGGSVRLQAYPSGATLSIEGTWALFRLVERGNPQPGAQPDRLQLAYNFGGAPVAFELRAASFYNPFRLRALEEFQCPGS